MPRASGLALGPCNDLFAIEQQMPAKVEHRDGIRAASSDLLTYVVDISAEQRGDFFN
jgi:hypothetical protein